MRKLMTLTAVLLMTTFAFAEYPALKYTMDNIDGEQVNLADKYGGQVVLAVNVASKCGYTKQYKGLQALHEKYADKGLAVLGFPCNQFGGQEPGSDEDIKQFCESKFDVTFDMFSKIEVNGDSAAPLYQHLKKADDGSDIKWNFEKFLIGRDGQVIKRYRSKVKPEQIAADIEKALAAGK